MKVRICLLGTLLTICLQVLAAEKTDNIGLGVWQEAIITTQDPEPWLYLFTTFADWQSLADSQISPDLLKAWGVAKSVSGREIVLANPDSKRGFIRLIHLKGMEQDWIRSDDRPWDTGGIFDLNIRVNNLKKAHKQLRALGWQGDSIPNDVIFGPFEVVEWIARGPDGVRFAFIERIKPKLEGFEFTQFSRVFNSTQVVADIEQSLNYYRDVLGMSVQLEHRAASKEPGTNVLGLPHEATAEIARVVYILNAKDAAEGQIELLAFDGASGRDLSTQAQPYNIGLSVLRYQVKNLTATIAQLTSRGAEFLHAPISIDLPPYGQVKLSSLRAPEGAHLEVFEVLEGQTLSRLSR